MTDHEIIAALIARDNSVTRDFFFRQCRPLFTSVIRCVFDYDVDYNECISELYLYLLENDGERLKQFEGRSTLFQWLKVTAARFFVRKRHHMIENTSREPLYDEGYGEESSAANPETNCSAAIDVESLLNAMPNRRYALVLRRLIINDLSPEQLAAEMNITIDNLYNVKRRAILQLTQVALRDIRLYEKH